MPVAAMQCGAQKLLASIMALGLVLILVALFVATGESIRQPNTAPSLAPPVEAERPLERAPEVGGRQGRDLSAWPTP